KMEDTNTVVNESVTAIGTTRASFSEIEGAVEMLNELIEVIVDSTEQMSSRSSEVDIAIGEIAAVSQESSGIAEEVAASSQEQSASTEEIVTASEVLAGMAQELSEHAAKFSL
ncbi:MAG: methyl-accepting chemotaxis protein, partial [Halanaerobiaceae bacterium]